MAFQTGSQINPSLGAINYTPYMQGAVAGAQSIGQGIANLGQGIASGIEQYQKQKKENQAIDAKIKENNTLFESLKPVVDKLPPQFQQIYSNYAQKIHDPNLSRNEQLSLSEGGVKALSQIMGLGMQAQEQQTALESQNRIASAALALGGKGTGPVPVANRAAMLLQQGFSPSEVTSAQELYNKMETQRVGVGKTIAETSALGVSKPTKIVWPTQEAARSAGVQANPGFDIKVNPTEGGWTFNAVEKPQSQPDPVAAAIVSAQVPMIQASFDAAQAAPAIIENIHKQKDLINSGEVPTGILSSVETTINKIKSLFGDKSAEAASARTAEYDKLLNQQTYEAMRASGLKASQLNTEKEWERFNQAIAAPRSNPKDAALAILDLNEKAQRAIVKKNKEMRASGATKRFEQNSVIPYSDVVLPSEYVFKGNTQPSAAQPAAGGGNVIRTYDPVTGTLK